MPIFFKCKSCQREHRSPAGFLDQASFDASPMPECQFRCRSTGITTIYSKRDMYWITEPADRSARGPNPSLHS